MWDEAFSVNVQAVWPNNYYVKCIIVLCSSFNRLEHEMQALKQRLFSQEDELMVASLPSPMYGYLVLFLMTPSYMVRSHIQS